MSVAIGGGADVEDLVRTNLGVKVHRATTCADALDATSQTNSLLEGQIETRSYGGPHGRRRPAGDHICASGFNISPFEGTVTVKRRIPGY